MQWFRFYHEFIDDTKVMMMSDSDQLLWVKTLCLASASKERGAILMTDEEVCFKLRISLEQWKHAIDKFRAKGMIEHCKSGYKITKWEGRQYKAPSDFPEATKARKRKQRAKEKAIEAENMSRVSRDIFVTSRVTSRHTDTDTDPDTEKEISKTLKHTLSKTEQTGAIRAECESGIAQVEKTKTKKPNEPTKYSQQFCAWWKDYLVLCNLGKCQAGSKLNAWKEWQKNATFLSSEQFERYYKIFRDAARKRLDSAKQGKLYLKHGERFLKHREWEGAVDAFEVSDELCIDITNQTRLWAAEASLMEYSAASSDDIRRMKNQELIEATRKRDGF